MATTTNGYPYPTGADRVRDGDDAIKALAEKVDVKLRGGIWSAQGFAAAVPVQGTKTVAVTYPVGVFTAIPNVVATYWGVAPQVQFVGIAGIYAASVNLQIVNMYTVAGDIYFMLHAHQA